MTRDRRPPSRAARPQTPNVPQSTGWRRDLERISAPALVRLSRLPRLVMPLVLAALLVAGLLLASPWGPVLLLVLAGFLGWLITLSWPRLTPGARVPRVIVLGALVAVAVWGLVKG